METRTILIFPFYFNIRSNLKILSAKQAVRYEQANERTIINDK